MQNTGESHLDPISELKRQIIEIQKEQERLRKQVREYRDIIDNAVEGIFRITLEGEILDINPAAAVILGYESREDLFAHVKKAEDIWGVPEDRDRAHEQLKRTGCARDYVMQARCKNGQLRWVTVNVRLVRNESGDILYNEGTFQDIHERKMLEDELMASKKLTRTLFDLPLDHVIMLVNTDGTVLECNQAVPDILKKNMSDIIGTNLFDYLPPDAAKIRKEKIKEMIRTRRSIRVEDMVNGRWYDSTACPIPDQNGNITTIAAFSYDITDRKKAEDELDHILTNSFDLICVTGFDLYFHYINPAWEKALGYSREELMSMPAINFIHPEDHSRCMRELEEVVAGKTCINFSCRVMHKDGSLRNFIWTATPVLEKGCFYCIGKDITQLVEAEEKLRKSEARFRSYFELPLVGIGITSPQKGWIEANDRLCEMLGYSREELTGLTWDHMTHPDDLARDLDAFRRVLDGDIPNYSVEKRYRRKDGGYIWAMLSVAAVRNHAREIDYIVAIVQDISVRKKMEEELRMHRDHLGKLVAKRTEEAGREIVRRKEKEEQYLALVESVVEWVWETDENFVHTYVSPRISEYLGHEPEVFLGKTPYDFLTPEGIPVLRRFAGRRKPFTSLQVPALHKNGEIVLIEGSAKPFYDKNSVFKGYRGSWRNITEQKRTMDTLKDHEKRLMAQSETLRETNAALRVLLKQWEDDKKEMEDMFVSNIKEMILPYISKMQKDKIEFRHKAYLDIITTNLNEIMAPFLKRIRQLNFTPKEIEVASLIRDGKSTKEIAELMGVATSAIDSHRNNIRAKLGLVNKDINLRSYLMTFK